MPTRREFFKSTGGAFLAASSAGQFLGCAARASQSSQSIGVQLYTVRRLMAESVAQTLDRVAAIGYEEVEFAGYFDHSPAEIKDLLGQAGLTAPSVHVGYGVLTDQWEAMLDTAQEIGHDYLVCPSLPRELMASAEGYKEIADVFNNAGSLANERRLKFAFHNHAGEFELVDGRKGYDVLLEECDPELVSFQMDIFWTVRGGADPLEYFDRHPGRFTSLHVKDMAADGSMVDVGQGEIDFERIFSRRDEAGIEHLFVEHDNPADPIDSITNSHRHMRSLGL